MPKPKPGESEKDYVSRCIPVVLKDGTAKDNEQAAAVCYSMFKEGQKSMDDLYLIYENRYVSASKRSMDPNVGGGVDRDKIPEEDFAGKNRSYPIKTPGDVYDAAQSIGRAGADNYSSDVLRANITKIAKRKGEAFVAQLPKEWTGKALTEIESSELASQPDEQEPPTKKNEVYCDACDKSVTMTTDNKCPDCGADLSKVEKKSLNIDYAKSLGLSYSEDALRQLLAVKRVSPDMIFHYVYLWGNAKKTDISRDFFTPQTNFWDDRFSAVKRAVTWDHAQDESMKADPVIGQTEEWGNDEIGRWALSHLDKAHKYRKAVDRLIERGVLGTSSDSVEQYVVREPQGKSMWIKTWPWVASALTDQPCEFRMVRPNSTVEFFKSIGLDVRLPEAPESQAREMVQRAHRIFDHIQMFGE
jgi:hypothetical protein